MGEEIGLHYRCNVTFQENTTCMTIDAAGRILAIVNNLLIDLIKLTEHDNSAEIQRHYNGQFADAFDC